MKKWVKLYVRAEALKDRDEPRELVAERIREYLEGKEARPSIDTLVKMISSARSIDRDVTPWCVADLPECAVTPEALPTIMRAWAAGIKSDRPLTIRQVKWIGRLYHALKDEKEEALATKAIEYANLEQALMAPGLKPESKEDVRCLWLWDAALYFKMSGDRDLLFKVLEQVDWQKADAILGSIHKGNGQAPDPLMEALGTQLRQLSKPGKPEKEKGAK